MIKVKVKQIENGKLPYYKRDGDVCMDCCSRVKYTFTPNERHLIPLGFALELPAEYEAVVRPRSGNSKDGIDVAIGTIDTNYRGEVMACVINNSNNFFTVNEGERICQLAIRKSPIVEWEIVSELSETNRNDNGFGSTGLK